MLRLLTSTGCMCVLLFAVGCGGSPQETFDKFTTAVKNKDGETAWGLLAKETQSKMEGIAVIFKGFAELGGEEAAKGLGMTLAELKTMDGKKFFIVAMKKADDTKGKDISPAEFAGATLENVKIEGDKATGTVKSGSKSQTFNFVKEDGKWKLLFTMPDMTGKDKGEPKPDDKKKPKE